MLRSNLVFNMHKLGREYILTGHTDGQLDGAGRLIIDNGIFRKVRNEPNRNTECESSSSIFNH